MSIRDCITDCITDCVYSIFGQFSSVDALLWAAAGSEYSFTGKGSHELKAQFAGEGEASFTNSELLLPDHNGVYVNIPANTAPWHGARQVENLCDPYFTETPWRVSGSSTITLNAGVAPDGSTTAAELACIGAIGVNVYWRVPATAYTGQDQAFSSWVKGTAGEQIFIRPDDQAAFGSLITFSGEWERVSGFGGPIDANLQQACFETYNRADTNNHLPNVTFLAWHPQLEDVSGASNQAPSEFVDGLHYFDCANPNTVDANGIVTEGTGTLLPVAPSLYAAPALTNDATYSNDQTNAIWAPNGDIVSARDETGLTGQANTATTLTDNNTSTTLHVKHNLANAYGNLGDVTAVWYIKKDNDETRFVGLYHNGGGSQRYMHLNTKTGEITNVPTFSAGRSEVVDGGDYWLAYSENQHTSVSGKGVYVMPASGTVAGTVNPAATGSCVVLNVELHAGKTIAEVRGAGPIITAGTAATSTAVQIEYDLKNHRDEFGAYYAEWHRSTADNQSVIAVGIGASMLYTNGNTRAYDGTNIANVGSSPSGRFFKAGTSYGSGSMELNVEGAKSEASYDGEWTATFSGLVTGRSFTGAAPTGVNLIRNIRRYNLPYDDAKAKIDELMAED